MTNAASITTPRTLNLDELDQVAAGIIIVGGAPLLLQQFVSPIDKVALNPQPLPPRVLSLAFGH
jgi:hypothetical protein